MTQEEKFILLQDLCARLPYGVKVQDELGRINKLVIGNADLVRLYYNDFSIYGEKALSLPLLRPLSSMTEEEKKELLNLLFDKEAKYFYIDEEGFIDGKISDLMKEGLNYPSFCPINIELYTNFLLSHHFDYRGLIEKGLALEAPEGMYEY